MKIKEIKSFYIINEIIEHKKIKEKLLLLINKLPKSKFTNISHTDWNLPREMKREYLNFFYEIINPYMNKMAEVLNEKKWIIHNGWFQQYIKNDFHDWHRHESCNFTNVYYLELPNKNMTTKLATGLSTKNIIDIKAKEGDLITFPACTLHTSKKINNESRKTIISFNSSFYR